MSYFQPDQKGIQATVLLDSITPAGYRLTTFVLKYPRWIHSELLTHRLLSKNSASSRAIPISKMIRNIINDPAQFVHIGKNTKGMQAKEELQGVRRHLFKLLWKTSMWFAICVAWICSKLGAAKQISNRLLEPFMNIEIIMSSTYLSNLFQLRCHPDSQPEFNALANKIGDAYCKSTPKLLQPGEWHIPFSPDTMSRTLKEQLLISAGRCARVSYLTHDGKSDEEKDIELATRLYSHVPMHASPFEHQAVALTTGRRVGNFIGWLQYRKLFQGEWADDYKDLKQEISNSCIAPPVSLNN